MLSGMRPVSDSEREATDTYAPGARTEFDLINAGAEKVFELEHEYMEEKYCNPNPNRSWAIRTYSTQEYDFPILSVSGPSSDPEPEGPIQLIHLPFLLKNNILSLAAGYF